MTLTVTLCICVCTSDPDYEKKKKPFWSHFSTHYFIKLHLVYIPLSEITEGLALKPTYNIREKEKRTENRSPKKFMCATTLSSYLFWQLWVVSLSGGKNKNRAERGHILQQGEESALHSIAHCLPPLRDMWHEHHTGHAPAGLTENLEPYRYIRHTMLFNSDWIRTSRPIYAFPFLHPLTAVV